MSLKVGIILAYFGPLPPWFRLWLESCAWNPEIDFLVITDQEIGEVPQNVRVEKMGFCEVGRLAGEKLGLAVCLERPYKLCDFKPAYGLIFEDYLEPYDYWGHCDADLIFGDLCKFFRSYSLMRYQRFLDLGHLSLYRNDEVMKNAFRLTSAGSPDWRTAFMTDSSLAFDEGGMRAICIENGLSFFQQRIYADISKIYRRFRLALNDTNYDLQAFYVEDGRVFRAYESNGSIARDEFAYIHFKERRFTIDQVLSDSAPYFVGPDGFSSKAVGIPSRRDILNANPYPGGLHEFGEKSLFWMKGKYDGALRRLGIGGKGNGGK